MEYIGDKSILTHMLVNRVLDKADIGLHPVAFMDGVPYTALAYVYPEAGVARLRCSLAVRGTPVVPCCYQHACLTFQGALLMGSTGLQPAAFSIGVYLAIGA